MPVSRRRVFNAMNIAINNNFQRINVPQLENGQYKVKNIYGFTEPKPEGRIKFRLTNPSLSSFPGNTIIFYGPSPKAKPKNKPPKGGSTAPNTPGSRVNPDIPIFYEPGPGIPPTDPDMPSSALSGLSAGQNPGPGYREKEACLIPAVVKIIDNEFVSLVTDIAFPMEKAVYRKLRLAYNLGKLTLKDNMPIVIEVWGWKRKANKLPPDHPNYYKKNWLSVHNLSAAQFKVYEGTDNPIAP